MRAILAALLLAPATATAHAQEVRVFAAASLKGALDEAAAAWTGKTRLTYAASSALARQIEAGAPADLFISADLDWMAYLAGKKLIDAASRTNLLGNRLVLIAPKATAFELRLERGVDLAGRLGDGRLAMANVAAVPAGKYGKAALEHLGMWSAVAGRVAQAENVRAALLLVARGEAPLGIVYRTDAAAEPGVRVVALFPEASHPPIVYPLAVIAASTNAEARRFATFLREAAARRVFEKHGFSVPRP
ncbi:MAG TPA: molybdate ABC transporter substrate-binding protein [Reyranellaceae bacterium]|nr:molybdate ABC transporter substrate-binding protein [Reyranellaceae bacterium]